MLLRYKFYVEHHKSRFKFYELLGLKDNATLEEISLAATELKIKIIGIITFKLILKVYSLNCNNWCFFFFNLFRK